MCDQSLRSSQFLRNASYPPTLWLTPPPDAEDHSLTEDIIDTEIFSYDSDEDRDRDQDRTSNDPSFASLNAARRALPTLERCSRSSTTPATPSPPTPSRLPQLQRQIFTGINYPTISSYAGSSRASSSSSEPSFVWPSTPEAQALTLDKSWSSHVDEHHGGTSGRPRVLSLTGGKPKHLSERRRKYPRTMSSHHLHAGVERGVWQGPVAQAGNSSLHSVAGCPSGRGHTNSVARDAASDAGSVMGRVVMGRSMRASARSLSCPDLRVKPDFVVAKARSRSCVGAVVDMLRSGVRKCISIIVRVASWFRTVLG